MLTQIMMSKTMMFALALAVFGVIETQIGFFSQYMTPQTFGLFNIVISVIVAVLRILTTMPLNKK